jgi:hypothetical protein
MSDSATLAAKLELEGRKLTRFMVELRADEWNAPVYADGGLWTTRSVFAHLLTAERAFIQLFDQIRLGGPGVTDDFDIDRYNASQQRKTAALRPADLVGQFPEIRGQMVALVSGLADVDLEKRARHPFLGVVTLREMIRMIYIHGQTHYRDVRRALTQA